MDRRGGSGPRRSRQYRERWLCAALTLLALAVLLPPGIRAEESQLEGGVEPVAADDGAATYLGDAVCLACHEALQEGFTAHYEATRHAKIFTEQSARNERMARGCEACHGPGSAHVEAGGGVGVGIQGFSGTRPEELLEQDAVCLGCHQGGEQRFWTGSVHQNRDVGCTGCHEVMRNVSERHSLTKHTQVGTCQTCHPIQNSRSYRNAHMPLRPGAFNSSTAVDGKMTCGSCHNPHGTVSEKLIDAISVRDSCLSCHAEKRGPFLWEHAPATEDCLNCHDPHGTTRNNMLVLDLPRLCTACHGTGHAGSPRDPAHRFVIGTSCLQCHQQVHGSNHPSGRLLLR